VRPAATVVGAGSLYACSTHSLIYQSDGATWTTWFVGGGAGTELDYVEGVGGAVSATAQASGTTIIASNAVVLDGSAIWVEVSIPYMERSTTGSLNTSLWDGSTDVGITEMWSQSTTTGRKSLYVKRKLTPSAGSHTFSLRGWITGGGTGSANGGSGPGSYMPIFIRVSKA